MEEQKTELGTLPAEIIINIAEHVRTHENHDNKRMVGAEHMLCGCGQEEEEGRAHTEKLAGKGFRFHSDVLKFASLSHRLRDIIFEGNKPACISMPFYRSAVIACKWMRQDLLKKVK
jgi:hypothetical protein